MVTLHRPAVARAGVGDREHAAATWRDAPAHRHLSTDRRARRLAGDIAQQLRRS